MDFFAKTFALILFIVCIGSLVSNQTNSEAVAIRPNMNVQYPNIDNLIVGKEKDFELMSISPNDYFTILNNKKSSANAIEPNTSSNGSNILPRRTVKKAPSYCLPIIHANHPDLIDKWDGIEPFETFLFRNNYLINPNGDDIFEFSKDDEFRVLFTKK
jgi:hypothetical protein